MKKDPEMPYEMWGFIGTYVHSGSCWLGNVAYSCSGQGGNCLCRWRGERLYVPEVRRQRLCALLCLCTLYTRWWPVCGLTLWWPMFWRQSSCCPCERLCCLRLQAVCTRCPLKVACAFRSHLESIHRIWGLCFPLGKIGWILGLKAVWVSYYKLGRFKFS